MKSYFRRLESIINSLDNNKEQGSLKDEAINIINELKNDSKEKELSINKLSTENENLVYLLENKHKYIIGKPNTTVSCEEIMKQIPALVYFKNTNNKLVYINSRFTEYTNLKKSELIGKTFSEIFDSYDPIKEIKTSQDVIQNNLNCLNIEESFMLNGKRKWWITNLSPVYNNKKKAIGIIGVSWDVSTLKIHEKHLEDRRDKEIAANHARGLFLANMSHEIRTPVSGIIGMTEILMDMSVCENQKEHLSTILSSGNSLLNLLNDILDFSKIEAGKIDLKQEQFSIRSVISEVQNILKIKAEKKQLRLKTITDESIPCHLIGDSLRLKQILFNLGNNAIKFTSKGTIFIEMKLLSSDFNKCTIEFSVKDTGIGIKEKDLDIIFNTFSQLENQNNTNYEGFGLGLAITKGLIDLMKGHIEVNSKFNKGSEFSFSLEFTLPQHKIKVEHFTKKIESIPLKNISALVADDNPINLKVTKIHLENHNIKVDTALNGEEAICLFKKNQYNFILMDVQMPLLNGFEATLAIRKYEREQNRLSSIPIIALTANAMKGDKELCIASGMNDYISKPFSKDKLIEIVKKNIL